MYRVCITNRHLLNDDVNMCQRLKDVFENQECKEKPDMVILREKDMEAEEYLKLAKSVLELCSDYDVKCILHTYVNEAKRLSARGIHLTMNDFRKLSYEDKMFFLEIGVSTHTIDEAVEAVRNGASYITTSHIFQTECKKGLEPKGLGFLKDVVDAVNKEPKRTEGFKILALGGINEENADACIEAGAHGVCMMSKYMC